MGILAVLRLASSLAVLLLVVVAPKGLGWDALTLGAALVSMVFWVIDVDRPRA